MNDKRASRQQRRIHRLLELWRDRLWLGSWSITPHYHRGDIPSSISGSYDEDGTTLACTRVRWEYLDAEVHFDLEAAEQRDDAALEKVVVHELLHVVLREMREVREPGGKERIEHEERVCTMLTNVVQSLARRR